jgi:hypothetical protein
MTVFACRCRSDYRALQRQLRELQRLLGKNTLNAEILQAVVFTSRTPVGEIVSLGVV